jgi:hypothetical protein
VLVKSTHNAGTFKIADFENEAAIWEKDNSFLSHDNAPVYSVVTTKRFLTNHDVMVTIATHLVYLISGQPFYSTPPLPPHEKKTPIEEGFRTSTT